MSAPRIRRVAPFNPTDIGNCSLWFDGNDPAGTGVQPAAGNLATWVDKTGGGINAIAGTSVYPQFIKSFQNGLGVVDLTNAADYFTVANNLNSASLTYVLLVKPTTANTGSKCGFLSTDTPGLYGRSIALNNMVFEIEYYNGFSLTSITTNSSTWYIISVVFNGTSSITLSYNGIISTYSGSGTGTNSAGLVIGSYNNASSYTTYNANFYLAEAIVYSSALSQTQYQQVEGYLAQKWGLRGSFPTNHPGVTNTIVPIQRVAKAISVLYYTAFNPSQISGCQIWLDAADSTTHTFSDSLLTAWRDKSTNAYNFNQLAPAASGLSATNAVIGTPINGLRTLYFDPGASIYQSSVLDGVTNVFWVGRIATGGGNYFLFGANSYYDWHAQTYPGKFLEISPYAQTGIRDASPSSLFTSDAAATTNAAFSAINMPTAPAVSILSVAGITGSTRFQGLCYDRNAHTGWCGDLAEVITFNAAITTTQRQQIESYLAQKWGLVPQLPANHLHATLPAGTPTFTQSVFGRVRNTFLPTLVGITATGGDVVHVANGYKSHIFVGVGSQTFTFTHNTLTAQFQVLVVGGGGGGGFTNCAGGGGAGGAVLTTVQIGSGSYAATVGGGGPGGTSGQGITGDNSVFYSVTGTGGGGGGSVATVRNGLAGGCGGGGSYGDGVGAAGTQGGTGGNGNTIAGGVVNSGAGGGGMGGNGFNANTPSNAGGAGGSGQTYTLGGKSYLVAGGGGGGSDWGPGLGGSSIGGDGGSASVGRDAVPSTGSGGGGGGGGIASPAGGSGSSGLVILSYPYPFVESFGVRGLAVLSYLPMLANSTDFGQSPKTVTTNGTVTYTTIGGKKCAYFSNSMSNYLSFPYTVQTQVTLCFWLYCIDSGYYTAVSITNGSLNPTLQVDINTATNYTNIYTAMPDQWQNIPSGNYGGPGQWAHFAITLNYATFVEGLFINGSSVSSVTGLAAPTITQTLIYLGRSGDPGRAFNGYLRHFCSFPTILTQAQIQAVRNFTV